MTGRSRGSRSTGPLYGRLLVISPVSVSVFVVAVSPIALDLFGGSANSWARRGRWELGQLSEAHLREAADTSESRRARRFHQILDCSIVTFGRGRRP